MSRTRTIQISALNIAMHAPHSPDRYADFMMEAFWLHHRVKLSNVHYAMIGSASPNDSVDGRQEINGEIYRFVRIDPNEPFFNDLTKEPATDLERQEVNLPEHLLPHLQTIPFIFLPETHRFYFVTRDRKDGISPHTIKKILEAIFGRVVREKQYPEVDVTVIPSAESVEKILQLPNLEKVSIELMRPNPDDGHDDETRWMRKMESQNAKTITLGMIASKNEILLPDAETKALARVAANNGRVIGEGRDHNGIKITESTDQIPMIKTVTINPNVESKRNVLSRVANEWND